LYWITLKSPNYYSRCYSISAYLMGPLRILLGILLIANLGSSQNYTISTFAGGGVPVNVSGTSAYLGMNEGAGGVAADTAGNLYFTYNNCVLRWDAVSIIVTLVAGSGEPGFTGDGGPAASTILR